MNITPIYELRTQLRNAAIAGTSLLPEDFRLKKAAENFQAISAASPVFAKIDKQIKALLNDNSPQNLLETLTLVDAVITALAAVGTKDEIQPIKISENRSAIVNAPYSQLSEITNALTLSGSGNYSTVKNTWENTPDIFNDYRVRPALVSALGASYSETAELAAKILTSMGKSVIPVLKNGFDPKGKKDMVRRIEIMEKISGSEENEFYLEQLETAEKDVKRELIFALGQDESNTEKLIDLTKTEKGKNKKAALRALASFDNKTAEEYINEYSVKKPEEVIEALDGVSSQWTSDLAARLIKELLVDENGNTVTLSETVFTDKCKLKAKTNYDCLYNALIFKYGSEAESVYRDYSGTKAAGEISKALGISIAATDNEGLKKLAAELNSSRELKGKYTYAETAARIFGSEDCSDWLAKQLKASGKDSYVPECMGFLYSIGYENGGYFFICSHYDKVCDKYIKIVRPVSQPIKEKIIDILIKHDNDHTANTLEKWIDPGDPVSCEKIGNYFVKHFRNGTQGYYRNLSCIRKCGLKNIKGLVCAHFKHIQSVSMYELRNIFGELPGDHDYKLSEARAVAEDIRKGKIKTSFDVNIFTDWAENQMK